jgi:acetyl-CoA carboxylase carboxyltransferase component
MHPGSLLTVAAPLQGTIVEVCVPAGTSVTAGTTLVIIESMKMEHLVEATADGTVHEVAVQAGATVHAGATLLVLDTAPMAVGDEPSEAPVATTGPVPPPPTDRFVSTYLDDDEPDGADDEQPVRADLAAVLERHAKGMDDRRPESVARRRKTHQRTARENVDDLIDPGSFVEYGPLAIAAQRRRRPVEELIERTPADGLIGGVASVEGVPTVVMTYDYTVLAGTQGMQNHRKKDRLFEVAERRRLPIVFFTEGGGGRPGDTDAPGVSGLDVMAFNLFARLSGWVPLVGIASGRCFAGNAALLGCCDVVIATEGTNIGMGGPAMIEGGGLGVVKPEQIGPVDVQTANGVIDIAVADEAAAVVAAKQYLSYFRPRDAAPAPWSTGDLAALRDLIPENRVRVYDVRRVIEGLADEGSVLELRAGFGAGMVTALTRVEGRPVGVVANNPVHLGGAIDADGADKAARFLQLCDAYDIPVLFLCDTPGIMVGPEAEATGLVRHVNRLFVTGANLSVPTGTIILRKGYGLGAQAMAGGSFKTPLFCVAWPTGEVGGMGLEGAVKLGFRRELDAVEDPAEREALYETMVAAAYEHGKALNSASHFEIDDVIDPADSRRWITSLLTSTTRATAATSHRLPKKRPYIDTW